MKKNGAEAIGTRYALALSGGTLSLIAGLVGFGIGPRDEVIIPGHTFMTTAAAVLATGAIPVLAEIDESLIMDLHDLEKSKRVLREINELITKVEKENTKLLADTFHMNIEEPSITGSFRKATKNLSHVHFADSNRWAPGCGHLDFDRIISVLGEIGYNGAVSAEILPKPDPAGSVELAIA